MKTIRVIQLIILLVIVAVLIAILVLGITGNFSMPLSRIFRNATISNSVLIYDQVYIGDDLELVDTELNSADLEYHYSENNEIRVIYYGPESEKESPLVNTVFDDSKTLKIKQQNRINVFNMISGEKVVIYLPAGYDQEIVGDTASGDILFEDDMRLDRLSLGLSSGNVRMGDLVVETADIMVSSGKISANAIKASNYRFKLSSGDIKISELEGTGEIISTSGDTRIEAYIGGGSIKSTSGSADIGIISLGSDLDISLTSGDISIDLPAEQSAIGCHFEVLSGSIRTNFGNVNKNLTGASFNHDSANDQAHNINIKTTSGNIKANVQ